MGGGGGGGGVSTINKYHIIHDNEMLASCQTVMRISWQWLYEAELARKNFHNFMLCNLLPEYGDINCTKQLMK